MKQTRVNMSMIWKKIKEKKALRTATGVSRAGTPEPTVVGLWDFWQECQR